MSRRHILAALGLLAPACAPTPVAHRGHTRSSAVSEPPAETADAAAPGVVEVADASDTGPVPTMSEGVDAGTAPGLRTPTASDTSTTVLVTVPTSPPTTVRYVLPETADEEQSDAAWWAGQPGYECGGYLPPCWVMERESGDPTAVNAGGCGGRGCFGKWQFDPRTSRAMGYSRTMDQYPVATQDEAARALWAGGRGCAHWAAC